MEKINPDFRINIIAFLLVYRLQGTIIEKKIASTCYFPVKNTYKCYTTKKVQGYSPAKKATVSTPSA